MEELLGIFRHQQKALPALAAHEFLRTFLLLDYLYVVLTRQKAQRLDIGAVLLLHDEAHGGAGLAAAEALVYPLGRRDIE